MRLVTPSVIETAFWIILCGSLAVGIGMETDWGTRWRYALPNETADAAKLTTPTLTESYGLPVADEFLETAMRPLFIVTRRPIFILFIIIKTLLNIFDSFVANISF